MNLSNRWPAWPQWLLAAGAAAAAAGASAPLRAQTASTTTAVAAPAAAQQIEVTGQRETLPADQEPSQRLSGEQLRRRAAPTLGATLQDEPGVANASFGPNVGLPVIRGLSGTRVRALFGGAGAFDASTFSADHAVMTEPLLAESITVRRGPAAVRHGGGAIGGAVEIEDRRIPREVPAGLQTRSELRAAAGQVAGVLRLDSGLANADGTGGWAWHADVHGRRQGDVRIPGSAIDAEALRQQFGLSTARNSVGRIANTASHSGGGAVGSSWVGNDGSFAGMALSTLRLDYGVPPGGHSHAQPTPGQPETAEEAVRIRARQHRLDGRAELALPWALAPLLKLRAAGTDYRHDERDGGVAATTFLHRAGELKAEINHRLLDTSDAQADPGGSVGVSFTRRRFSALGDEFFAPQTEVQGAAAFLLQAIDWAGWRLEAGLRAESQVTQPEAYALQREGLRVTKLPPRRRFQPLSASLSARRSIAATEVTLTAWSAERAPELQELYADGPHLASRTYDLGNENLDVEQLRGVDIGLARRIGSLTVRGNAFHYRSDSYIVQRSVGRFYNTDARAVRFECARLESCLAVTQYEQAPARLHGYEVGAGWPWRQGEGSGGWRGEWRLDTDAARGRLASGGDLPRLPPRRVTLGFEAQKGSWLGDARLVHARPQTRPGANETPTAGWTQLHASLHHSRFNAAGQGWSLFGIGRNLTDRTARNSTSFLRNLAPEPGRSLFVGLEVRS